MSTQNQEEIQEIKKRKTRIAFVVTDFHAQISESMLTAAKETTEELNGRVASSTYVPGAYEIPLTAKHLLNDPLIDAIVVLGWIEKGETLHGEVMGHVLHTTLVDLGLEYDKPIGFGIIGPGATEEQAHARAQIVARRAVEAVCRMNGVITELRSQE